MNTAKTLLVLAVVGLAGGAAFIASGAFNIAADEPHWPATYRVLELTRDRSIAVRSADVTVPDLSAKELISSGAGNYNAMCVGCHLAPGAEATELSAGLYPAPPPWKELGSVDPKAAFWVLKHGIKMSGMPAWGKSMEDRYLWGMVAFLKVLPTLDEAAYTAMVHSSPGHHHGGGETDSHTGGQHAHDDAEASSHRSSFEPEDEVAEPSPSPAHDHH